VYAISEAIRSLRQHLTSTLATFFTALVSFSLLFVLGLLLWNLDRVVVSLERELEIAAFLKPGTNPTSVINQVRVFPGVTSAALQSKEEALATLQLDYPYLAQAKEFVQNPLPDTVRIKLSKPQQVRAVGREVGKLAGVESVEYGGALTEQLVNVLAGLRVAANILIALLLLDTFFSVMGTIRLSIENRRDELRVMQLIGATQRFIQAPFIAEGIVLTLVAGFIAMLLGTFSYQFLSKALQVLLPFVPVLGGADLFRAAMGLVVLALLLGGVGAYVASRANLREAEL
jgi:cell division transport system permease protein